MNRKHVNSDKMIIMASSVAKSGNAGNGTRTGNMASFMMTAVVYRIKNENNCSDRTVTEAILTSSGRDNGNSGVT